MNCITDFYNSHSSTSLPSRRLTISNRQTSPFQAQRCLHPALPHHCPVRPGRRSYRLGRRGKQKCRASEFPFQQGPEQFDKMDSNQLQTALNNAIKAENYAAAALVSKKLKEVQGAEANLTLDWRSFGCPDWLAERAEQMGFRFPTGACSLQTMLLWHKKRSL